MVTVAFSEKASGPVVVVTPVVDVGVVVEVDVVASTAVPAEQDAAAIARSPMAPSSSQRLLSATAARR
jgi:hypothetical protein